MLTSSVKQISLLKIIYTAVIILVCTFHISLLCCTLQSLCRCYVSKIEIVLAEKLSCFIFCMNQSKPDMTLLDGISSKQPKEMAEIQVTKSFGSPSVFIWYHKSFLSGRLLLAHIQLLQQLMLILMCQWWPSIQCRL